MHSRTANRIPELRFTRRGVSLEITGASSHRAISVLAGWRSAGVRYARPKAESSPSEYSRLEAPYQPRRFWYPRPRSRPRPRIPSAKIEDENEEDERATHARFFAIVWVA